MEKPSSNHRSIRPTRFLLEVRRELTKVAWPTRKEVVAYSMVVMVAVAVLGSFVLVLDILLKGLLIDLFMR